MQTGKSSITLFGPGNSGDFAPWCPAWPGHHDTPGDGRDLTAELVEKAGTFQALVQLLSAAELQPALLTDDALQPGAQCGVSIYGGLPGAWHSCCWAQLCSILLWCSLTETWEHPLTKHPHHTASQGQWAVLWLSCRSLSPGSRPAPSFTLLWGMHWCLAATSLSTLHPSSSSRSHNILHS